MTMPVVSNMEKKPELAVPRDESSPNLLELPLEIIERVLQAASPNTAVAMSKTCKSLNAAVFEDPLGYPWERVTISLCPHTSLTLLDRINLRVTSVKLQSVCKVSCPMYPDCGALTTKAEQTFGIASVIPVFTKATSLSIPQYEGGESMLVNFLRKFPAVRQLTFCPKIGSDMEMYRHILNAWPHLEELTVEEWSSQYGSSSRPAEYLLHRFAQFLLDATSTAVPRPKSRGSVAPLPLRKLTVNSCKVMCPQLWDCLGTLRGLSHLAVSYCRPTEGTTSYDKIWDVDVLKLAGMDNLTYLSLRIGKPWIKDSKLTDDCLPAFVGLGRLKTLHLPSGSFKAKALTKFFHDATFAESLKELEFTEPDSDVQVTDEVLIAIGTHLQALESFEFSFICTELTLSRTNKGFTALARLPRLSRLAVRNRSCFSSKRHPLVDVQFLKPLRMGGGEGAHPRRGVIDFTLDGQHFNLEQRFRQSVFSSELDSRAAIRAWCPGFRGQIKSNEFKFTG